MLITAFDAVNNDYENMLGAMLTTVTGTDRHVMLAVGYHYCAIRDAAVMATRTELKRSPVVLERNLVVELLKDELSREIA